MPISPTYPGVYIDELPSAVHTITGVPTSVAAFVGATSRGPTDGPVHVGSLADYQRVFGGVASDSPVSYAVLQFFLNGGSDAEIVRLVHSDAKQATIKLGDTVAVVAVGPGPWGGNLRIRVDYHTKDGPPADGHEATSYNLSALDAGTGTQERYLNISTDKASAQSLDKVLKGSSLLALPASPVLDKAPPKNDDVDPNVPDQNPFSNAYPKRYYQVDPGTAAAQGTAGSALDLNDYQGGATGFADKKGIYQLYKTNIFNLLCLPGAPASVLAPAAALCGDRRAILLVDPPSSWVTVAEAVKGMTGSQPVSGDAAKNAAVYFPNIVIADPANNGAPLPLAPCGTMAGVAARTDVQRGVWKAPAGTAASLAGVTGLASAAGSSWQQLTLTDADSGQLNPLGVNVLRDFPVIGPVSWGARTLAGADVLADQWKYLPVRRLALFIEESLFRGTKWTVFEPNAEPLWGAIRLNVGAFMNNLFRLGAFAGTAAKDAYLVKCDAENNPQNDIDLGIVNIVVGFAPLKPAEFVIIHIEQLAGQLQT
jgi:phage tail sheath protein FI